MTQPGKIFICATPIGNLGDVTERVLDALRSADVVFAEDTRVSAKLMSAFGISARLERMDEAKLKRSAQDVVERAKAGEVLCYCTDAGMPGVSDPGRALVRVARDAGVSVEVLPGASAAACAYVASGCLCPRYYFGGFLPRKAGKRTAFLASLTSLDAALVFFESPHRLLGALTSLAELFPKRHAAVCRELTKLHEEVARGTLHELRDLFAAREVIKGEIVIVIDGPSADGSASQSDDSREEILLRAAGLLASGCRKKEVVAQISQDFDLSHRAAYDLVHAVNSQELSDKARSEPGAGCDELSSQ